MTIKIGALAILVSLASFTACLAVELQIQPATNPIIRVDWQEPQQLPPAFRNHCTAENFTGRPYCSNHCGIDYQFYYCTEASFGCCRLGHGYCDWEGHLRCHP